MNKDSQMFSADFETSTWIDDESYVWAWGIMSVKAKYMVCGTTIESFLEGMQKLPYRACIWFYNLKFDGQFIIHELYKQGFEYTDARHIVDMPEKSFSCLIGDTGAYYNINIKFGKYKYYEIYDTTKKLPMPLAQVAKKLGIEDKGKIDYSKVREKGGRLSKEDFEYLYTDCLIQAKALEDVYFKNNMFSMTMGSDALLDYKMRQPSFKRLFPVLDKDVDAFARKSYKGGFCYCHRKGRVNKKGVTLDVNSMYSSMEHSSSGNMFPYGIPIHGTGMAVPTNTHPLYIQHLRAELVLKDRHIPTIQIKGGQWSDNEYLKSTDGDLADLYLTDVDMKLMFDHYEVLNVQYIDYQLYQGALGLFDEYVDYWMAKKIEAQLNGDYAGEMLAKGMLNNLYGKFGLGIDSGTKIPYIDENGLLAYELIKGERKPVYVPVASWNTAYARDFLIRRAQMNYDNYLYSDTDANHYDTTLDNIAGHVIDKNNLCCWKIECEWDSAIYIRQKTYGERDMHTGKWTFKCAGLSKERQELLTPDNFRIGYTDPEGKKRPKRVRGGINIVTQAYEMKP